MVVGGHLGKFRKAISLQRVIRYTSFSGPPVAWQRKRGPYVSLLFLSFFLFFVQREISAVSRPIAAKLCRMIRLTVSLTVIVCGPGTAFRCITAYFHHWLAHGYKFNSLWFLLCNVSAFYETEARKTYTYAHSMMPTGLLPWSRCDYDTPQCSAWPVTCYDYTPIYTTGRAKKVIPWGKIRYLWNCSNFFA